MRSIGLVLILWASACGSKESTCKPGVRDVCDCPGGKKGWQTCGSDSKLGACDCKGDAMLESAKELASQIEQLNKGLDEMDKQKKLAEERIAAAKTEADRKAAEAERDRIEAERQRLEAERRAKLERSKGVHLSQECIDNPLSPKCAK